MKKKVYLAIFFEHELSAGGNFQQPLNAVKIAKCISEEDAEILFITTRVENLKFLKAHGVNAVLYKPSSLSLSLMALRSKAPFAIYRLLKKIHENNHFESFLSLKSIDIIYFTSQSKFAEYIEKTNYIYTLFDLCHRDQPGFPEVSSYRNFENRELHFKKVLAKAFTVIVESELGKINSISRYGLDGDRISIFPSSPASAIGSKVDNRIKIAGDIKCEYYLKTPYVFYPAQFWAHKNHIYILQALKLLENDFGVKLSAIFSGSDKGNMAYIRSVVSDFEMNDRVRFIGFVDNDKMIQLYQQSIALVMPTYFGPTNLPPLEAFSLGVPVLYSDLAGLREQVGDAALLLDLSDPRSLANHLNNLMLDPKLSETLALKGFKRLNDISVTINRVEILNDILRKFYRVRICWG